MAAASTRLAWVCGTCQRECIPIRSESRCLCGHRHKEHDPAGGWRCASRAGGKACPCSSFFYIVAEGSWVLRCRCKHKHVEHAAATRACARQGCPCGAFDSPWVCNCDHPWSDHQQIEVDKASSSGAAGTAGGLMQAVADINRWDLLERGGGLSASGHAGASSSGGGGLRGSSSAGASRSVGGAGGASGGGASGRSASR